MKPSFCIKKNVFFHVWIEQDIPKNVGNCYAMKPPMAHPQIIGVFFITISYPLIPVLATKYPYFSRLEQDAE